MKRLTGNEYSSIICIAIIGFAIWTGHAVDGSCLASGKQLRASATPVNENFTEYYKKPELSDTTDCHQWIIKSGSKYAIKLVFSVFELQNSTESDEGDYIEIFDGHDENANLLDKILDKLPQSWYLSSGREMLIVYHRGDTEGLRNFSMSYSSVPSYMISSSSLQPQKSSPRPWPTSSSLSSSPPSQTWVSTQQSQKSSPSNPQTPLPGQSNASSYRPPTSTSSHSSAAMSTDKIIRIAGIVGAVLAFAGLTYVVLKVTNCCSCIFRKQSSDDNHADNSSRERVRLAADLEQERGNNGNRQINMNIQGTSHPLTLPLGSGNASSSANHVNELDAESIHDSDTDSLPDVNEVPPSYESLYLNELGEGISPPKYSPPKHRSGHPPRRVHTFN